jgi:hypothetical protein
MCRVYIIGSIPGRHRGGNKSKFGHLKLRQVSDDFFKLVREKTEVGKFSSKAVD